MTARYAGSLKTGVICSLLQNFVVSADFPSEYLRRCNASIPGNRLPGTNIIQEFYKEKAVGKLNYLYTLLPN